MNRTLSTLLTLAGLAAGYHVVLGRAHLREMAELNREIDACYTRFEQSEIEATHVTGLQKTVADLERWQKDLQQRLTADPLAMPTTSATRALFEAAGIQVERAEPVGPDGNVGMPHQRLRLVANGSFVDLFAAMRDLENEAVPTRVTDLTIQATPDPQRVRAELTLVRAWGAER